MQKEAFVNVGEPWWFTGNLDTPLKELRERLGESFGWDGQTWHTNENNVTDLYALIESHEPSLVGNALDDAVDDPKREQWIHDVFEAVAPGKWNAEFQMLARAGLDGSKEFAFSDDQETVRAGTQWMTQEEAEAAKAAHAKESETGASETEESAGGGDPGAWDDNWKMLLRTGPGGVYQFAFSDDKRSVRAGTNWMSQEEATAAKAGANAGESEGAASESEQTAGGTEQATGVGAQAGAAAQVSWDAQWGMFLRFADDKYQYSLSNLLSDGPGTDAPAGQSDGTWHATAEEASAARKAVSDLKETFNDLVADPQVPISEEDLQAALQDPDFQKNLAEADAALEAELAELESES